MINNKEIWKDVHLLPFSNKYAISSLGRLKNKKTGNILKGWKRPDGYTTASLTYTKADGSKEEIDYTTPIHRLVAEAFLKKTVFNPDGSIMKDPNHAIVNHKDHNKGNNTKDNLEWCDYSFNAKN